MFKTYDAEIKKILKDNDEGTNWKEVLTRHKLIIQRIQHERLIHLLVTIFVGLVLMSSLFITLITKIQSLLVLDIPLLALFTGYMFHYRFLENTTQEWYVLEDAIESYCKH